MPLIDMHIHIQPRSACSYLTGKQLLRNISHQLNGVCITDHFRVEPDPYLQNATYGMEFKVFFGVEITAREGDLLAYGISQIPSRNMPAKSIIKQIHDEGGIAVCAHPFSPHHCAFGDKIYEYNFDAVEINGGIGKKYNKSAKMAAEIMDLPTIGGSDAHSADDLNTMCTLFKTRINTLDDIIEAIKKGQCRPKHL